MQGGLKLASLYSYPPASLKLCGVRVKNTPRILANYICGKNDINKIKKVLENFEASFPYYQLIAKVNKIDDPFHCQVVEAYWLGNELLEKVKYSHLKNLILNDFTKPGLLSEQQAKKKASLLSPYVTAHHSFHVFSLGSITGRVKFDSKLYDLCRIGWGEVLQVQSSKFKVQSRSLLMENNKFLLGEELGKEIDWDKRFLPNVKVGDIVTFHWNFACQVITKRQEENLLKYTLLNIKLF